MSSSRVKTLPVGLCGELRMIIFVFGVTSLSSTAGSNENPFSSMRRETLPRTNESPGMPSSSRSRHPVISAPRLMLDWLAQAADAKVEIEGVKQIAAGTVARNRHVHVADAACRDGEIANAEDQVRSRRNR